MVDKTLQQRLQGTWRLESYVTQPTPDSMVQRPTFPMTKNVTGLIMYTADGYMSAQMLMPGQVGFEGAAESQWAEAAKRSFTYAGPYYITKDGQEEVLRHSFELCVLPNRVGEVEMRSYRFEEDDKVLILGGKETTVIKGDVRIPILTWRRVESNAGRQPPQALPEIKVA